MSDRRPAELERATGAGDVDRHSMANEGLTTDQRRALQILAGALNGCTEPALRGHGFTVGLMVGLVAAGLAVAKSEVMMAAGRSFGVMRFLITDIGRAALGLS